MASDENIYIPKNRKKRRRKKKPHSKTKWSQFPLYKLKKNDYFDKLSKYELSQIRIRQPNSLYVVGLPSSMCSSHIIRSNEWFGQFGTITHIYFPSQIDSFNDNYAAYIIFSNTKSTPKAIQFANSNSFEDGRKLKATLGTQRYLIINNSETVHKPKTIHTYTHKHTNTHRFCHFFI
eukprot:48774_1